MSARTVVAAGLLALLAGCSTALLEDIGDAGELAPLRLCSEPVKLFNAFTMRAARGTWKDGSPATLTLDLTFDNDRDYPLALSNSGSGILYTLQITLRGEKSGAFAPKEASGILLMREPKKFKEPERPGVFGRTPPEKKEPQPVDNTRDVNFRIPPGAPEAGRLTFQAPRGNYLLTIERKLPDKPTPGRPSDHAATCRITANDMAAAQPAGASGVY